MERITQELVECIPKGSGVLNCGHKEDLYEFWTHPNAQTFQIIRLDGGATAADEEDDESYIKGRYIPNLPVFLARNVCFACEAEKFMFELMNPDQSAKRPGRSQGTMACNHYAVTVPNYWEGHGWAWRIWFSPLEWCDDAHETRNRWVCQACRNAKLRREARRGEKPVAVDEIEVRTWEVNGVPFPSRPPTDVMPLHGAKQRVLEGDAMKSEAEKGSPHAKKLRQTPSGTTSVGSPHDSVHSGKGKRKRDEDVGSVKDSSGPKRSKRAEGTVVEVSSGPKQRPKKKQGKRRDA